VFDMSGARSAVFWIAAVAIVVAQAAILRTARQYVQAPVTPEAKPKTWLEAFWAVAPAVALAGILLAAWRLMGAAS
jgi:heme/copper-type cytochrome/quinol oxidase subunit 2